MNQETFKKTEESAMKYQDSKNPLISLLSRGCLDLMDEVDDLKEKLEDNEQGGS